MEAEGRGEVREGCDSAAAEEVGRGEVREGSDGAAAEEREHGVDAAEDCNGFGCEGDCREVGSNSAAVEVREHGVDAAEDCNGFGCKGDCREVGSNSLQLTWLRRLRNLTCVSKNLSTCSMKSLTLTHDWKCIISP